MIHQVALLALLLASGASARMPGLTVPEVWQQHAALDGKVIRVSGVVTKCAQLACSLRSNIGSDARTLSLGSSDQFDGAIQSRLGLPVVIEGRLDSTCLHSRADELTGRHGSGEIVVCLDRASELANPRLVSLR